VAGGLVPGGFVPGGLVPGGAVVEPGGLPDPGLEVGGAAVPDGLGPGEVVGAGGGAIVVVLLLPPEPEPPVPEPPDPEPPEPRLPEPELPEVELARSVVQRADEAVVLFDEVLRRLAVESLATVVVVVGGVAPGARPRAEAMVPARASWPMDVRWSPSWRMAPFTPETTVFQSTSSMRSSGPPVPSAAASCWSTAFIRSRPFSNW
jgi:hypothetical protein